MPMLIELVKGKRISILKIDIEGAELELFSSSASWIDQVDNFVIELHGEDCEKTFFAAIKGRSLNVSRWGEVTACLQHHLRSQETTIDGRG